MPYSINSTHDATLKSWVTSANDPNSDFPIQNLPFGVFTRPNGIDAVGVAIGDQILSISECHSAGLFEGPAADAAKRCGGSTLHQLIALGRKHWSALRIQISRLLRDDTMVGRKAQKLAETLLVPMTEVRLSRPIYVGDYTDFYASVFHATNVGLMMRPDNPLLPNYKHVPIGYHGRASSIVMSGTPVHRPFGQTKGDNDPAPVFGPSKRLDYELEVGFYIGQKSALGSRIAIEDAEDHLFGLCIVNDWSARDVQRWEYQPLGPFLAKSFATSLSPWVVSMEALAPFRCPAFARPDGDPQPLPYLSSPENEATGGIDLTLEVFIASAQMWAQGVAPMRLSQSSLKHLYWTPAQLLTHHTSNGCNMRIGDMFATGTVSGPDKDMRGSLLELTWGGKEPLTLPTGEMRRFLEDGDEVIMHGFCQRPGFRRIGLGECRGTIVNG